MSRRDGNVFHFIAHGKETWLSLSECTLYSCVQSFQTTVTNVASVIDTLLHMFTRQSVRLQSLKEHFAEIPRHSTEARYHSKWSLYYELGTSKVINTINRYDAYIM